MQKFLCVFVEVLCGYCWLIRIVRECCPAKPLFSSSFSSSLLLSLIIIIVNNMSRCGRCVVAQSSNWSICEWTFSQPSEVFTLRLHLLFNKGGNLQHGIGKIVWFLYILKLGHFEMKQDNDFQVGCSLDSNRKFYKKDIALQSFEQWHYPANPAPLSKCSFDICLYTPPLIWRANKSKIVHVFDLFESILFPAVFYALNFFGLEESKSDRCVNAC